MAKFLKNTNSGPLRRRLLKAIEDYQNEFRFHFPHEHRPAGRPAKTTPLTPVLAAENAEFTVVNGWERVDYFKPKAEFHTSHSFHFDEAFDLVAKEVEAVQTGVGLAEVNGFNRIELTGSDRHSFLDRLFCGAVTKQDGRVGLGYLLNHHGMVFEPPWHGKSRGDRRECSCL